MKRIIAIDDSPISREIYRATIADNHCLKLVEDAEEAIEQLTNQQYDLIISDCNLPGMSGIELLKWAKRHEFYKDIPFIVISSDGESISEAKKEGVRLWLIKPVIPKSLLLAIEKVIEK